MERQIESRACLNFTRVSFENFFRVCFSVFTRRIAGYLTRENRKYSTLHYIMTQSTPPSNKLETEPVGKLLWQYAVPAIVGTMVMSLYTIIDRIFIGQGVGPDAISGLALTFPIMNLTAAVGMLVGAGASARISIVLGQKDPVRAEKILGNSLVLTLALAACYILFFIFLWTIY